MRQKRKMLSLFLVVLMLLTQVIPTLASVTPLIISEVSSIYLENGKDAEMEFKVVNTTDKEQNAHLITALYDKATNEMLHYNYVVENLLPQGEKIWGACIPIPDSGEYKVKVFAWDDMQNLKLLSNVLEVGSTTKPLLAYDKVLKETSTYLAGKVPAVLETIGGEWSVLGLARSGYLVNDNYYEDYYQKAAVKVKEEVAKEQPFDHKITEVQRLAIALTAIGKDAQNIEGINLIDYTWNKGKNFPNLPLEQQELGERQGLNELIFGLITIDLRKSDEPADSSISRNQIIDKILTEYSTSDGGFSLSKKGEKASIDITAMAIQSLAPYYQSHEQVKKAIDKALGLLSKLQTQTGGFVGEGTEPTKEASESTAQVIVALTALGIDPTEDSRFIKGQNNPITHLLSYYEDNGQFKHTLDQGVNMMATEQCHYALVSYDRLLNHKNPLYDMADVVSTEPENVTVTLTVDRSSIAAEEVLEMMGYSSELQKSMQIEVKAGSKIVDVLEVAADQYGFDIQLDAHKSYVEEIDKITHAGDARAFEILCTNFGLANAPSVFGNAGWMYTLNKTFGQGIAQDIVKQGDQIDFRYTLYYGAGTNSEWVNYDWQFIDAYKGLQELIESVDDSAYEGEELTRLQEKVKLAQAVIKEIDEDSQSIWIYYIGQKETSLWGPGSPTDSLEKAYTELKMAIDKVAQPKSIKVTPSGFITLKMGETVQLQAEISPENAPQEVTYEVSSGEKYIAVSETGVITPLVEGKNFCMIKVISKVDSSISANVFVNEILPPKPVGSVKLSIEKRTIGKGDTLSLETVDLLKGDTAWDVIKREVDKRKIDIEYKENTQHGGVYISTVAGDGEFDYGSGSGFKYSVNNILPDKSVSAYDLKDGDTIRLRYCVSVTSEEFNKPLSELLKTYIQEVPKMYLASKYTEVSYKVLQEAIESAKKIASDEQYASFDTDKELVVSTEIGKILEAIKVLKEIENYPLPPSTIPDDFINDIGLNKDFLEMKEGENYQIIARRLVEAIDNPFSNQVTHPTYHYEVVKGDSVGVDEKGKVTALKKGTSVIAVTYDELEANNQIYGDISPINTGLFVVSVADEIDTGIDISFTSKASGVVNKARSYDTYYFTEDFAEYSFSIEATNSEKILVKVNAEEVTSAGDIYTARLRNSGNIIEVIASNAKGTKTFAKVIDARKIEIITENLTDPTRNDQIGVGDRVSVHFKGITPPVYKLATIYNPSFSGTEGTKGGTKVAYTCEPLGGFIVGKTSQYDLATKNAIEFEATKEGTYTFTGGHIDQGWWGSPLGTEKGMTEPGEPNLNASHHHSKFSQLPDFTVKVGNAVIIPATGIKLNKDIPTIEIGASYQLETEITPADTTEKTLVFTSSDEDIAKVDEKGKVMGIAQGEVTLAVQIKGTAFKEEVKVSVIPELPATEEEKASLKVKIEKAKKLNSTLYTSLSWEAMQEILAKAERIYGDSSVLLAQVKEVEQELKEAVRKLEQDFSVGITISPAVITPGTEVTIYMPNLVQPNYMGLPVNKKMHTVYKSDIQGLERIKSDNGIDDGELLKTLTFTIPQTTTAGAYTLSAGFIEASLLWPPSRTDYTTFYEGKMPEIRLEVQPSSLLLENKVDIKLKEDSTLILMKADKDILLRSNLMNRRMTKIGIRRML